MNNIRGQLKRVPIGSISPNGWNYNEQTADMVEKTKMSIHKEGFVEPIEVRSIGGGKYEIIDGYHRWLACNELEFDEIVVVDLGKVSDIDLKRDMIAMNELHGESDDLKLADNVVSIATAGHLEYLREVWPGEDKNLNRLLELKNFSWESLKPEEKNDENLGGSGDGEGVEKDQESQIDMKSYSCVLTLEKVNTIRLVLDHIKKDIEDCSEGRAVELMCAEYLSGI